MSLNIVLPGTTRQLADFVVETSYGDLSQPALNAARRSLVNFLGVTIGGAHHEEIESALKALKRLGANGTVPILGRSERVDAVNAALLNGTSSAVLDFDSTQMKRTNIHPSGPVLPAILAFAHGRNVSGQDFIAAYVLGVEVACRVANGVFGETNPGWHVTGVTGGIGAAAAVARLLKLDAEQTVAAMAIAANQASGLREMYGTACKALTPGRAARDGLLSAMLAAEGFSAPERPIEGRKGLSMVFTGHEVPPSLTAELGAGYEIELNIFKPYPCAIVTHAVIDGVSRLCTEDDIVPADITGIELEVAPIAAELAGHTEPQTELQSKFSLTHAAAVAATHRVARVEHFSEAAVHDAGFAALRKSVAVKTKTGLRKNEAYVLIRTTDAKTHRVHVEHALGSLEHPMSDGDIAAKFTTLVEPVLGKDGARALLDRALTLAASADAGGLADYPG
jgi:2-methylcitrate dehydratase PrpD